MRLFVKFARGGRDGRGSAQVATRPAASPVVQLSFESRWAQAQVCFPAGIGIKEYSDLGDVIAE